MSQHHTHRTDGLLRATPAVKVVYAHPASMFSCVCLVSLHQTNMWITSSYALCLVSQWRPPSPRLSPTPSVVMPAAWRATGRKSRPHPWGLQTAGGQRQPRGWEDPDCGSKQVLVQTLVETRVKVKHDSPVSDRQVQVPLFVPVLIWFAVEDTLFSIILF